MVQGHPVFMEQLKQPEHEARSLVLLASSRLGAVGGPFAETEWAWLRISIMAVDPKWRSQGIGGALLAEAERLAISLGCRYAHVDTMEYQAPGFYQKKGFHLAGQLPDWDSVGHSKFHFIKTLT